jgi:hypothetical protein
MCLIDFQEYPFESSTQVQVAQRKFLSNGHRTLPNISLSGSSKIFFRVCQSINIATNIANVFYSLCTGDQSSSKTALNPALQHPSYTEIPPATPPAFVFLPSPTSLVIAGQQYENNRNTRSSYRASNRRCPHKSTELGRYEAGLWTWRTAIGWAVLDLETQVGDWPLVLGPCTGGLARAGTRMGAVAGRL